MDLTSFFGKVWNGPSAGEAQATFHVEGAKQAQSSARRADKRVLQQKSRISRTAEITGEITPAAVASAISAASSGNLGRLQGLYIRMGTDARFSGFVRALHAGLLAYPLRVTPSKTKTPASREYAQIAEDMLHLQKHSTLIKRLAQPYLTGVAIYEPVWSSTKGRDGKDRVLPYDIKIVPPTLYRMDNEKDSSTFGQMMIATEEERTGVPISEYPWGRILQATDGTDDGWYDIAGAARTCLFWYLVKTKNASWWAEFNEIYGEPHRIAYFDEGTSDEDMAVLENLVKNVGRAAYALLPDGVELDISDQISAGTIKTYEDIITLANTEMAIAILGQTQTSDGGEYGSYAKANVHMGIQYQILKSIALLIKETLDDLILSVIAFNVGPAFDLADLPTIQLIVPNPEEKEVKARVFKLAQEIGLPVPDSHVRDELGIPEPDEDDVVLVPQAEKLAEKIMEGKAHEDEDAATDPSKTKESKESENGRSYDKDDQKRKSGRDGS